MVDLIKIIEAFAEVEKHKLKVSNIVCTVCGGVIFETNNKPCEHLIELAKSLNNDSKFSGNI